LQKANDTKLTQNIYTIRISYLGVILGGSCKLLTDFIFESVHSEQRWSLPFIKRWNSMPLPLSRRKETQQSFFNNPAFFSLRSLYYQSIFNWQTCHVHMQGDVAQNMYPIPAVYQRTFNQLIQIFSLTGRQWSFLSILVKTAWFCCKRLQN